MMLTIIVTVYNEVNTIMQAINDVKSLDVEKEIIVIDNCSTDGTRELLKSIKDESIKIIYQDRNYGFGKSVETGIKLAKGKYIFIQYSDLEYEHTKCLDMIKLSEDNNYDAIFGSRLSGRDNLSCWKLIKERPEYLATIISTFLVNKWYNRNFTDVIGAKFYRTSSVRKLKFSTYGAGFDFEFVSKMCKSGFKIGEIPVGYRPRLRREEKKIKPYHMVNALFALFKEKFFT